MKKIIYKNNKDKSLYRLVSKTALNGNDSSKESKIQVLLQDTLTGGYIFLNSKQFEQDFTVSHMEVDNDEESDEIF